MSPLEILIAVIVVVFSASLLIVFFGDIQIERRLDPYVLKAKVFSTLKRLRYNGGFSRLIVDRDRLMIYTESGRRVISHGADITHMNVLRIVYTNGRITESGTAYGKGWELHFQPVTGIMRVEVK